MITCQPHGQLVRRFSPFDVEHSCFIGTFSLIALKGGKKRGSMNFLVLVSDDADDVFVSRNEISILQREYQNRNMYDISSFVV